MPNAHTPSAESDAIPGERCPLSGVVVTAIPHDDWIEEKPYRCHACGALVTYRIRESDYAGGGRLHTHKVPRNPPAPEWTPSDQRDVADWLIREADQRVKFFPQRQDGVDALMRHLASELRPSPAAGVDRGCAGEHRPLPSMLSESGSTPATTEADRG